MQDLKPRGKKTALGLIAWSVIPREFTPDPVEDAARAAGRWPDGAPYETPGQNVGFPGLLLAELLEEGLATIEGMADAMAHGAAKYQPWNWQGFTWDRTARDEYFGAILRHIRAAEGGEYRDSESGVRHYDHAAAGCMIWQWHECAAEGAAAEPAPEPEQPDPAPGQVWEWRNLIQAARRIK